MSSKTLRVWISLLLGAGLLSLVMQSWDLDGILEILRPLDASRLQWHVESSGAPPDGLIELHHGGRLVSAAELSWKEASFDVAVNASDVADPTGNWALVVPESVVVRSWSLSFGEGDVADGSAAVRFASTSSSPAGDIDVKGMGWIWIVPYLLTFWIAHIVRDVRWGLMIRPVRRLGLLKLVEIGAVGSMAVLVLPLRLGEFVRPFLASEEDVPFPAALAATVLERLVDCLGIAVILLVSVSLTVEPFEISDGVLTAAWVAVGAFGGSLLGLGVWASFRLRRRAAAGGGRTEPPGWARGLHAAARGLTTLTTVRSAPALVFTTVAYWTITALGIWCLMRGVGLTTADGEGLTMLHACAFMTVLGLGLMIPAGPAFTGSFELAGTLALAMFLTDDVVATRGAVFVTLLHLLQIVAQCSIGCLFLVCGKRSFRTIVDRSRQRAAARERAAKPVVGGGERSR